MKKYFYIDGKLYKRLAVNVSSDVMTAWSYDDDRIVQMTFSHAKRNMKNAYNTSEVAKLLNRSINSIIIAVNKGAIKPPKMININKLNSVGKPWGTYKWSPDEILEFHEYLLNTGAGRPKKNGDLYPATRIPTRGELIALLRNQPVFYMKTAEGDMVPVWSAYDQV
jgi:hypothetical protein